MKQFMEKRPTAVSVIGWFWIIVGGFMTLASVSVLLQEPPSESLIREMSKDSSLGAWVFRHYVLFALLQVAVAQVAIVSGIGFLRLRKWARIALEVLSWLGVAFVGAIVVKMIFMAFAYCRGCSVIVVAMGVAMISAIYLVPLWFILRSLRSQKVRDAVASPLPVVQ